MSEKEEGDNVSSTLEDVSTTVAKKLPMSYAVNKEGNPYRSFKLVSIVEQACCKSHTAVNRSKKPQSNPSHLGPLRAAQKIFDAWCREKKYTVIGNTVFCIQETTRGKSPKMYHYVGRREKLDTPRMVNIVGMKGNPITYAYRSRVRSLKLSKKCPAVPETKDIIASDNDACQSSETAHVSSTA